VDLDEILYGSDGIEDYLDSLSFDIVASTIQKIADVFISDVVQCLNRLVDSDEILHCNKGIKGDLDHSKTAACVSSTINILTAW
jgi:hypothetical protein